VALEVRLHSSLTSAMDKGGKFKQWPPLRIGNKPLNSKPDGFQACCVRLAAEIAL